MDEMIYDSAGNIGMGMVVVFFVGFTFGLIVSAVWNWFVSLFRRRE